MRYNSTEQSVSWFYLRDREGTLSLAPPFQRRPVWTRRQQSNLIESILLELPIPELYLQQKTIPDGTTQHVVVDGQQRIRAILDFIGANSGDGYELDYLDSSSPWLHRRFKGLTDEEKSRFFGQRLAVRMLDDVTDEEVRDIFRRINKYTTPLSAQELRNATYSGPFAKLAETLADDEYWAENRIVSPQSIRRMGDIEFVADLLIGAMHGPQGGDKGTIDQYYAQYEDFEIDFPDQPAVRRRFSRALDTIQDVLPLIKTTRWRNKSDFYTLFVVFAHILRDHSYPESQSKALYKALMGFANEVEARLENEATPASDIVVQYVRAVERGSNDKARRAARHQALLEVVSKYFRRRAAA